MKRLGLLALLELVAMSAATTAEDSSLGTVIGSSGNSAPVRRIFETARAFRLSAYDAVCLDAARSEQLPLASLDRQLLKAAVDAGVEILS